MQKIEEILKNNQEWAANKSQENPDFFSELAKGQSPDFLWIGCSDSRVPANQVTGTGPGDIFVHRNVANMVVSTDSSLLTVLKYGVQYLKVKHIVVCGHYNCGGVEAAMSRKDFGETLNKWLTNIKDVIQLHEGELSQISDQQQKFDRLVELNVAQQVVNLSKTSIIQQHWQKEQRPSIHGLVYNLKDGLLKNVCEMNHDSQIDETFKFSE